MRYDFLMHYGVKGMRWKNKKAIIDPSNTDIRVKKADNTPRIEKEKNLVLSGTGNKKFTTSEKETDDKQAREELNSKIEKAEQEDREAREEAARLAYEESLRKARERSAPKEEKVESVKKSTYQLPSDLDEKFRQSNLRDRQRAQAARNIEKITGQAQGNVMNDYSKKIKSQGKK